MGDINYEINISDAEDFRFIFEINSSSDFLKK